MSCYLVNRAHVRYLIDAALQPASDQLSLYHDDTRREVRDENAAEWAQVLWDENARSVRARYNGDETQAPDYGDHDELLLDITPAQVLKACDCYEYQTCETDDWQSTLAIAFVDALRSKWWRKLPGYAAAAWGAPPAWENPPANPPISLSKLLAKRGL